MRKYAVKRDVDVATLRPFGQFLYVLPHWASKIGHCDPKTASLASSASSACLASSGLLWLCSAPPATHFTRYLRKSGALGPILHAIYAGPALKALLRPILHAIYVGPAL